MLREETAKLLMMIQGAYPNYKPDNKTVTINTWNLALSDISFDLAQKAFLAYLRADTKLLLKDVDMIKYALLLLFRLEKRIIKHICEKH